MAVFKPLERLERKYEINASEHVNRGSCGKIYEIEKDVYAKIPFDLHTGKLQNGKFYQKISFNEFDMQKFLVDMDFKFPKTHGQYAIRDNESGKYFPGFTMDKIDGIEFSKLPKAVLEEAQRLEKQELEKLKEAGIIAQDRHSLNTLWLPKEEDICMLDSGLFRIKNFIC